MALLGTERFLPRGSAWRRCGQLGGRRRSGRLWQNRARGDAFGLGAHERTTRYETHRPGGADLHAPHRRAPVDDARHCGRLPARRRRLLHEHLHGPQDRLVVRGIPDRGHPGLRIVHGGRAVPVGARVQYHADLRVRCGHHGLGRGPAGCGTGDEPAGIRDPSGRPVHLGPFRRLPRRLLRRPPAQADDRGRQAPLPDRHRHRRNDSGDVREGAGGGGQGARIAVGGSGGGSVHAPDLLRSGSRNAACRAVRCLRDSRGRGMGLPPLLRPNAVRSGHPYRAASERESRARRDLRLGGPGASTWVHP